MKRIFSIICAALLTTTSTGSAGSSDFDDAAKIALLPGWQTQSGSRMMGIEITLAEGWHTYWRAPGDAGIPPNVAIEKSKNIAAMKLHWPVPQLYVQNGLQYLGYENRVIFPMEITPTAEGAIEIDATLDIGVCKDICIPLRARLKATVAPDAQGGSVKAIRAALADQPKPLRGANCVTKPLEDGMRLTAEVALPDLGRGEHAVLELPDKTIWVSPAVLTREGNRLQITSDFVPESAAPFALSRSDVTISVFGNGQAFEAKGCSAG